MRIHRPAFKVDVLAPGDQQPAGQKRRLEAGEEEEGTSSSSKMARLDQGSSGGQDKAERYS